MLHKHHSTHHAIGLLLAIVVIGGVLGGMSGIVGRKMVRESGAYESEVTRNNARQSRLMQRRLSRMKAREARLKRQGRVVSDVGTTYPMQNGVFAFKGSTKWNVSMSVASLLYPRLGLNAPIGKPKSESWNSRNWRRLEDEMQYLLLNGIAAYPHSTSPGANGSVIIAGHSSPPTMESVGSPYEDIFANLPNARVGDFITIKDSAGDSHTYDVRKTQIVPATYTQILLQKPSKKELILFTCYPVGTTRERFVVWGELVETPQIARR